MNRIANMIILFILVIFSTPVLTSAGPVPDTGQTASYADAPGEDSDYSINPPSYTKQGRNGAALPLDATLEGGWVMTRDNVTGLVWEMKRNMDNVNNYDDLHDADNTYTRQDSQDVFIAELNAAKFGGYSDWRMPSRKELRSIVHYDAYDPAIHTTFFPGTIATGYYWSSTIIANDPGDAWSMRFSGGDDYPRNQTESCYVRAVRGGTGGSPYGLIDNGDNTVTDTFTGLMWQKEDDGSGLTWEAAITYAQDLSLAGFEDWRLPNIKELDSITDLSAYNPAIDPIFSGTKPSGYWSSTAIVNNPDNPWAVNFYNGGDIYNINEASEYYVRSVRGGQIRLPGHLVVFAPVQGGVWNAEEIKTITWKTQSIPGNVEILLSRDGGKTFSEAIAASTPNDGSFQWKVTRGLSYNCVLKITPLDDAGKATTQGLFTIYDRRSGNPNPGALPWLLLLLGD